jgi:hypothetical protein
MSILLLLLLGLAVGVQGAEIPATVEESGSKAIDALVVQLVSARPPPHPSGYSLLTAGEDVAMPYMTARVSNAIAKLKAMGTAIFPALVMHLKDDRYSFSDISAAWDNLTVGDAVLEVLSDNHYMFSGYKARQTSSGFAGFLSFNDYLKARGPVKWAAWAKNKSRLDIQLDFIHWCVVKEQERGFIDEAQRKKVLNIYAEARETVRKQYSEPDGAANRGQPIPSDTNRTSAAAASRRSP